LKPLFYYSTVGNQKLSEVLDKLIEAQSIKYCQKHEKISISIFNSVATSRWRGGFAGSNHPDFDYYRCSPFALSLVPPPRGGLGVGFYFGGFSLGMTFYSVVFVAPQVVPAGTTAIVGAIPYGIAALHAFLLAGVCVVAGDRLK
jgi:hypothetical protein